MVQTVERIPTSNEKIVSNSSRLVPGGPAMNAAATIVALGGQARLVSAIGDSDVGKLIKQVLYMKGIELTDCAPPEFTPPISSVLINAATGDRSVVSANGTQIKTLKLPNLSSFRECSSILVDGHYMELCKMFAVASKKSGTPVIMDAGSWKDGTDQLLDSVDFPVFSADFRVPSVDSFQTYMSNKGIPAFAVSFGDKKIKLYTGLSVQTIEVPVVDVVDTLGAGDVLHGAVTYLIGRIGFSLGKIPKILELAAFIASESCRFSGALSWAECPSSLSIISKRIADEL